MGLLQVRNKKKVIVMELMYILGQIALFISGYALGRAISLIKEKKKLE